MKTGCPECGTLAGRVVGASATALGWSVTYDDDGQAHQHDPNWLTENVRCIEGHLYKRVYQNECWCGWPDAEAVA